MFMAFIRSMSMRCTASLRHLPESGQNEWRFAPLRRILLLLRYRPSPSRTSNVRKPNRSLRLCTTCPAFLSRVSTRYRFGVSAVHTRGDTATVPSTALPSLTGAENASPTALPSRSRIWASMESAPAPLTKACMVKCPVARASMANRSTNACGTASRYTGL